ncbi:MAG: response regulator [Nannocystaceae bacterium]
MTIAAATHPSITSVLVVDDSAFARHGAILCLRSAGLANAHFVEAGNGHEALTALKREHIDLVVTDMNMPEMNGAELLDRIKSDERVSGVAVLVVSSSISTAMETDLRSKGAKAVARKPLSGAATMILLKSLVEEV